MSKKLFIIKMTVRQMNCDIVFCWQSMIKKVVEVFTKKRETIFGW